LIFERPPVTPSTIDPDLGLEISGEQGRIIDVGKGFHRQDLVCVEWDHRTLT